MDIRWYGNHLSLMNMAIVLRPTYHDEIDAEIAMLGNKDDKLA